MPAYMNRVTTNATGTTWKRCFPNDAAGIYRHVTISQPSNAAIMRQASNTNNEYGLDTGVAQPLGICETADLEVISASTNVATISFFGSHPVRQP